MMSEKTDFLPVPDGLVLTRVHLRDYHGYPNRVMLRDEITDWEMMCGHHFEHGPLSQPNHQHDHDDQVMHIMPTEEAIARGLYIEP